MDTGYETRRRGRQMGGRGGLQTGPHAGETRNPQLTRAMSTAGVVLVLSGGALGRCRRTLVGRFTRYRGGAWCRVRDRRAVAKPRRSKRNPLITPVRSKLGKSRLQRSDRPGRV